MNFCGFVSLLTGLVLFINQPLFPQSRKESDTPVPSEQYRKLWNDPALLKGWEPWPHPGPAVGYLIEAALPWKSLGLDSKPGAIIGFDLFGHETDIEPNGKPAASVLRTQVRSRYRSAGVAWRSRMKGISRVRPLGLAPASAW